MAQPRGGEWVRYWRSPDGRVEAMHARFHAHTYHRHSHETYSFGVTEAGAQSFRCRGGEHTSAAGMVMAFNPDDPQDGHAADREGFTYRMVHVLPDAVEEVLAESTAWRRRLPLCSLSPSCVTRAWPVAAEVGFADQAHLTRWFVRSFRGNAGRLCPRRPR